ncbi:hypothetical protein [Phenylobacterium sp. SCN 70-31]|nr:hypothetical protein [Phenylobacterium sp. SCN 70-31]
MSAALADPSKDRCAGYGITCTSNPSGDWVSRRNIPATLRRLD